MNVVTSPQNPDRSKTIETLEGVAWLPSALSSYVAKMSFALRQKPLDTLTDEDIRIGLEQHVGVEYLVPLAVERLKIDPFIEARLYEGDLLESLLNLPNDFWESHGLLREQVATIVPVPLNPPMGCSAAWRTDIWPVLVEALDRFIGRRASRDWIRPNQGQAPPTG